MRTFCPISVFSGLWMVTWKLFMLKAWLNNTRNSSSVLRESGGGGLYLFKNKYSLKKKKNSTQFLLPRSCHYSRRTDHNGRQCDGNAVPAVSAALLLTQLWMRICSGGKWKQKRERDKAGLTNIVIQLASASGGAFELLPLKAPLRLGEEHRVILTQQR